MLAVKRVKKDLRDLIKNPLPGISLEPVKDDLKDLHFTVIGPEGSPYQGVPFHGSLEIPNDYPNTAPLVFYHNYVPVGYDVSWSTDGRGFTYICMNINSNWEHYHPEWKNSKNDGWGPGNTLSSILVQIQSAFFDQGFFANNQAKTLRNALEFKCKVCGHNGSDPKLYRPEIQVPFSFSYLIKLEKKKEKTENNKEENSEEESEEENDKEDSEEENDKEDNEEENDEEKEEKNQEKENSEEKEKDNGENEIVKNKIFLEMIEEIENQEDEKIDPMNPICFATKEKLGSEVYGVGFDWAFGSMTTVVGINNIEFEYLSEIAWDSGIKRTSTKKSIGCFFPLYFNQEHWSRARPKLEDLIEKLFKARKFDLGPNVDQKSVGGKLLRLFERCVIDIDKILGYLNRSESKIIYLYHWIQTIYQYRDDPDVVKELDNLENKLIKCSSRNMINQSETANLYFLLILLRPEKCSELQELILDEIIYHNQKYYKSKHPDVLDLTHPVEDRTGKVFNCIKDLFCRFLRYIRLIRTDFDLNQNLNSEQLKEYITLDRESFKIDSFHDFYQQLGEKFEPKKFEDRILSVLRRKIGTPMRLAIYDSKKKKTRRAKHFLRKERRQKKALLKVQN